jgi:uncharacterized protein (DUF2147 family)
MKNRSSLRTERPLVHVIRCSLLVIGLAVAMPITATAQDATGVWRTEATQEGYLEVRVSPCGAALCGTILRARDLQGREQPYPHVGRWMIRNMTPIGPNSWGNGQIWDPRNDRTFRSRMELSGNNLAVSGCVLGFCQSQSWSRVN